MSAKLSVESFPVTLFSIAECGADGVNLDGENEDDLMKFWHLVSYHPIIAGRIMFPTLPACYATAASALAAYAVNKATAMTCRARGDIQAAQIYEGICERIYADLPEFARW